MVWRESSPILVWARTCDARDHSRACPPCDGRFRLSGSEATATGRVVPASLAPGQSFRHEQPLGSHDSRVREAAPRRPASLRPLPPCAPARFSATFFASQSHQSPPANPTHNESRHSKGRGARQGGKPTCSLQWSYAAFRLRAWSLGATVQRTPPCTPVRPNKPPSPVKS